MSPEYVCLSIYLSVCLSLACLQSYPSNLYFRWSMVYGADLLTVSGGPPEAAQVGRVGKIGPSAGLWSQGMQGVQTVPILPTCQQFRVPMQGLLRLAELAHWWCYEGRGVLSRVFRGCPGRQNRPIGGVMRGVLAQVVSTVCTPSLPYPHNPAYGPILPILLTWAASGRLTGDPRLSADMIGTKPLAIEKRGSMGLLQQSMKERHLEKFYLLKSIITLSRPFVKPFSHDSAEEQPDGRTDG